MPPHKILKMKITAAAYLLLIVLNVVFGNNELHAQNSVVNFGKISEYSTSSDGFIENNGNFITILSAPSGWYLASFTSYFAVNWTRKVCDANSHNNCRIIQLSTGDFIANIVQESSGKAHILKFNTQGDILWHKKLNGISNINACMELPNNRIFFFGNYSVYRMYAICDFDGNVLISKSINSTTHPIVALRNVVDSNDGSLILFTELYGNTQNDRILLTKINATGSIVWERMYQYSGTNCALGNGIFSNERGIYLVGRLNSSTVPGNTNADDILLFSFSVDGDFIASRIYGGQFGDLGYDLKEANDGTFVVLGLTKPIENCSGNLIVMNINADLDTLYTKIYGSPIGDGAFYFNLKTRGDEFYAFGSGSLWSNIGNSDGHLIRTDKNFELGCELLDQGINDLGTLELNEVFVTATHQDLTLNIENHSENSTTEFIVTDACSGNVLDVSSEILTSEIPESYPNPFLDEITLESGNTKIVEIQITDFHGKIVFHAKNIDAEKYILNARGFSSGVYLLTVTTHETTNTMKIVKL